MTSTQLLAVAVDDGYASYDQEHEIFENVGARFEIRACNGDERSAVEAVRDADVVLVRETPINAVVIQAMERCRGIVRYGIGVDNVDQSAAKAQRIAVANVPDYGIEEVSTQAVALALAVMRRIRLHDREVRAGRWTSGILKPMYRLQGRTLGLVGYGRIARSTHEKFAGFGFDRVLVHDPVAKLPSHVIASDVDTICREADVISLHAPLSPETHHLINERRLALMRPTSILINTARGGLIDLDALRMALSKGQLLGAGLDVFEQEPPNIAHPIFASDDVVVTNHMGWYSEEAMRDLQRKAAMEAARVLSGEAPHNWLNRWE